MLLTLCFQLLEKHLKRFWWLMSGSCFAQLCRGSIEVQVSCELVLIKLLNIRRVCDTFSKFSRPEFCSGTSKVVFK